MFNNNHDLDSDDIDPGQDGPGSPQGLSPRLPFPHPLFQGAAQHFLQQQGGGAPPVGPHKFFNLFPGAGGLPGALNPSMFRSGKFSYYLQCSYLSDGSSEPEG